MQIVKDLRIALVLVVSAATPFAFLHAQKPTPTPLMDGRGFPLPFGVQPYYKPDYPLVPWKRIRLKNDLHCDLKGHANHRTPQTGVGYHR